MRPALDRLDQFFFPATSDSWLTVLRVGLGVQIIIYCLSLRGDWNDLLALHGSGLIQRDLTEAILTADSSLIPRLGWLIDLAEPLGVGEQTVLTLVWICLFCAGFCLLLGIFCRVAAVTAWFVYLWAAKSASLLSYGVDDMTTIGLFYLMLAPFPDRHALDRKLWKSQIKDRHLHGFFRRVLQLHLCVIYLSGGITKCLGAGWWNGESMWRALTRPPFNAIPSEILLSWKALLPVAGITVCLLETGYPVFIWVKKTRPVWLIAIVGMHIGIGITMGLYLFAFIMIVLNLAAFGPGLLRPEKTRVELAAAGLVKANSLRP